MNTERTELFDLIRILEQDIALNTDNRIKSIGDKVKVWDGSGNQDKNTGECRSGINSLFEQEAIVIEDNLNIMGGLNEWEIKMGVLDFQKLDLLLKFPSGEEVYCSSKFVQRIDNYQH